MGFIVSLICIQLSFIGYILEKKVYNFMTIFNGIWACTVFSAALKLFDMYKFSNKAYIIILIGNIAFSIGYLTIWFINKNKWKKVNKEKIIVFNYPVIWFFLIICVSFYIYLSIRVYNLRSSGVSYNMIRSMYQGYATTGLINNGWETFVNFWIGVPFIYVLVPIVIISTVNRTGSIKFLVVSLVAIVAYIYGTAARIVIVYFVIEAVFILVAYGIKIDPKIRKLIRNIILIGIVGLIILTGLRQSKHSLETGWNTAKSVYSYICVNVPLLDYWANKADKMNYYTYGLASLKGILELSFIFLNKLSFSTPNVISNLFNYVASFEEFVYIFPHQQFNAFVTVFYTFYLDFRYIGVIVGLFLYGAICSSIFSKINIKDNVRNMMIILIFLQGLFKGMIRFEFISTPYILAFIYIIIVTKNKSTVIKY